MFFCFIPIVCIDVPTTSCVRCCHQRLDLNWHGDTLTLSDPNQSGMATCITKENSAQSHLEARLSFCVGNKEKRAQLV